MNSRIPFLRRRLPAAAALLAILLGASAVAAQDQLGVTVTVRDGVARIGGDLVLDVTLTGAGPLDDGSVEISVRADGAADALGAPYPVRRNEAGPGQTYEWAAPVAASAQPAETPLAVTVKARTADGADVSGSWTGTLAIDFGEEWSADRIQAFIEDRGFAFFLVLVFGFGLLMSLSPCIYPMIPITLAVIGASSQEKGALHGLVMSVTYVIGMALVYAILGALSATVFSGITAFMQSPAVLVPIAVILLALAFSMFGAFELEAPAFLRDRLAGPGSNRGGLLGVFAMGLVAGLVASPCVGPFLAALLVWVATTGNMVWGFFSLFTFGIGMGILLIGVGTFPAMLGSMPRSGGWMDTVKKGMGLLLLVMALYFVRPEVVLPEAFFYPLVGVTAILVSVFMGAFDGLAAEAAWWPRARKALGLIVFAGGMYVLVGSFLQYGHLMPSPLAKLEKTTAVAAVPAAKGDAMVASEATAPSLPPKVPWQLIRTGENVQAFLDEQRALAVREGKPVMIDFWAQWCIYCKKLDKDVWNVPDVVAESLRFVTIKIDATEPDDEEMTAIKEALQVSGLPRVVFIDSRGEVLHGRSAGYKPADQMLELMKGIR